MVSIKIIDYNNLIYFCLLFIVCCSQPVTLCVAVPSMDHHLVHSVSGLLCTFVMTVSKLWETQLNVRIIAEKLSLHVTVSGSEEILWKLILRLHPENTRYRRGGWSMFQSIYCVKASQFYLVIWHEKILDIHISINNNGIIYIFQNGAINTWQIALRVSCSSMEIG